MLDVTMRLATVADIAAVLAFWQTAAKGAHRPPDSAQALEVLLELDPEALLLAVDDSGLIGTVIAGWDGWRCHIYRLAVAPQRRRQGIGRMLVKAAEERFHRLGGIRVDAMVLDDNAAAHRAWQACGYEQQAEWSRWVKPLS